MPSATQPSLLHSAFMRYRQNVWSWGILIDYILQKTSGSYIPSLMHVRSLFSSPCVSHLSSLVLCVPSLAGSSCRSPLSPLPLSPVPHVNNGLYSHELLVRIATFIRTRSSCEYHRPWLTWSLHWTCMLNSIVYSQPCVSLRGREPGSEIWHEVIFI